MKQSRKVIKYMNERFNEVLHTTLNPEGPGAVRIHLIPPDISKGVEASVAIINGQDIIPVNFSWAIVLAEFIHSINKYDGKEMSEEDISNAIKETVKGVRKVFFMLNSKLIKEDLLHMLEIFTKVARGEEIVDEISYMNIGEYSKYMKAPHRMDIMVSAMEKENVWNCNQKCINCYAAGQVHSNEKELTTDEWKNVLDKLREIGVPQVTFTGGEPTIREDLFELIKHARWFISRLNSNGIKLTRDYCEKLKEAEIDSVQITFYSCDKDVHNYLVGTNGYDMTVEGIKNALSYNLGVSINTPLCKKNRDYVKTLKFLKDLGVTYVTCSGIITTGNALNSDAENLQLTNSEIKEVLKEAVDFCYQNGMEINFTSPGWIEDSFFKENGLMIPNCGACLSNMAITPSGNVVPCQSWLNSDTLGNLLKDNWEDIWNSDYAKERRKYSSKMLGLCPLRRVRDEKEI